jgi:hypothetical protein
MRAALRVFLVGSAVGLPACPVAGDGPDRTTDMDAAAKAFLETYHGKNLVGMMAAADAPFAVGTIRRIKTLATAADLRAELKSRLPSADTFPTRVAKTLTWERAVVPGLMSAGEEGRTREQLKPVVKVTGADGGYAALADLTGKRKNLLAMSDTRLLVGIRGGTAKVVGIVVD